MAANLDWLYTLAGCTIAGAGLLLLLWALFRDRSRGRRRCPKCWYDMAGVPGLQCPECGKMARDERKLHRTRRRPFSATLGALLTACGLYLPFDPIVQRHGWLALAPSWILVNLLPAESFQESEGWTTRYITPFTQRIETELSRRAFDGGLGALALDAVVQRCTPIVCRDKWVIGEPLVVSVRHLPSWVGPVNFVATPRVSEPREVSSLLDSHGLFINGQHDWFLARRTRQMCGTPQHLAQSVEFDARIEAVSGLPVAAHPRGQTLWTGTIALPTRIVPTVKEAIAGDASAELTEVVSRYLRLQLARLNTGGSQIMVRLPRPATANELIKNVAVGIDVELRRDGELYAAQSLPLTYVYSFRDVEAREFWEMPGIEFKSLEDPAELACWTIKVRGNGSAALSDYTKNVYWAGEYEIPLSKAANWLR